MATDKLLHRIQSQINDLAPVLELFVDQNVQPSVNDCSTLQKHLSELQENLAVYKYNKQNKEISPSFNLHSKLSEVTVSEPVKETPVETAEPKKEVPSPDVIPAIKEEISEPVQTEYEKMPEPLKVGINDKFRFMNELFAQNAAEYNIAIEQINNLRNWSETEIYLNSLKNVYDWKENLDVVKYFYSLVKKRFD